MTKIKVLIVDDSAVVRQTLTEILNSDASIEVIGAALDPIIALEKMKHEMPDVIILDIEMPRMNGLTFLQKIMKEHPLPVIMCSSQTERGCDITLKALEYGAVEIIRKPKLGVKEFINETRIHICDVVKAAVQAGVKKVPAYKVEPKLNADVIIQRATVKTLLLTTEKVVVIGASTGGTEALQVFLQALPDDSPAIVIVQHMPEQFTKAFANRLNTICQVEVKEAENNDVVCRGRALIGPGNKHILLKHSQNKYFVEIKEGPLVSRHRPSVDVLFRSASRYGGKNIVGVIMTGMGDDGAKGMLEMKESGGYTIAQDENTSVVFGMPKEAIKLGGVNIVLPLEKIVTEVLRVCKT